MKTTYIILLIVVLASTSKKLGAQTDTLRTQILQPKAMQEDLTFMLAVLTETHPGIFRYTSQAAWQTAQEALFAKLQKPLSFYTYYQEVTALLTKIHCAHTHSWMQKDVVNYFKMHSKVFPCHLLPLDGHFYIILNGTPHSEIQLGDELLSINGQKMDTLQQMIINHYPADGFIQSTTQKAFSDGFFSLFYYAWVAQPDQFRLELKDAAGKRKHITVEAASLSAIESQVLKNPVNAALLKKYIPKNELDRKKSWRLEFPSEGTALMTLRNFSKGNSESQAKKEILKFLTSCAKKLKANATQNLIIDVRHNGGGWDIQGGELFRFLLKSPSRYYQRLYSITKDSEYLTYTGASAREIAASQKTLRAEADGTFSTKEETEELLQLMSPSPHAFQGKVYVLMNAQTASAAAEFTALVQSNQLGTCVGEETGGGYEGGTSGTFLEFTLPNSGIYVKSPLLFYENAVKMPAEKGRGTLPDIPVERALQDVLDGVDTQLQFVLDRIRSEQ